MVEELYVMMAAGDDHRSISVSTRIYNQTCVKRPDKTRYIFWLLRQVVAYCCMKIALKPYSAIYNHLSIVITKSPEWMVISFNTGLTVPLHLCI